LPFTLNGIGTHYYGAKNRSARVDVCSSCHRSATLSSYDTRECFCIVFIPIIPLGKYRIIDDCSSCRRHRRMKFSDFTQHLDNAIAPLREAARRTPGDVDAQLALVQGLVAWEMRDEAQREIADVVARFPSSARVHAVAGQLAIDRADWKGALPFFERAHALDPQDVSAVYGHGWLLHNLGRHEEAVRVLQRSISLSENRGALYLLGISYSRLQRWNEALQMYQRLLGMEPRYNNDKAFLRLIAEAKKQLGYVLSEEERKASRRWWPFGGGAKKPKQPALQGGPTLVRPALRIPGLIILALALFGGGYAAWDNYTNIALYVDNGLSRPVQVELDGKRFDVPAHGRQEEQLQKGAHAIVIYENDGKKELERMTVEVPAVSIFDSIGHDRFFVYNVASSNVYRRSDHGYAVREEDSTYGEDFVGMQRFFEQRDVDFPFSTPPDTIKMDSGSSVTHRIAFNVAQDLPLATFAVMRAQQQRADEAKAAIRQAVTNAPCDLQTRQYETYVANILGPEDAASAAARQWISACDDALEAHRAYQQMEIVRGRVAELQDEYRKRLDAAPQSAQAHYLYGRIVDDANVALAEHTEATRLDPKLVWPRVALGYTHAEEGRYDDAMREMATALDMEGHDPGVASYYATAAIAKGTPAAAVEKIEQLRGKDPKDVAALDARWLLALAAGDWEKAKTLQTELAQHESPNAAWWRRVKMLRLKGDDPAVDLVIDGALRRDELRSLARLAQLECAISRGEFERAATLLQESSKELDLASLRMMQAYVAGGMIISGKADAAAPLIAEAAKGVESDANLQPRYVYRAIFGGLNGTVPEAELLKVARANNVAEHAWFVAGVRAAAANDRAKAAECFTHAAREASDLDFPYLEVKKMAELVK
jgi:tetratricopeptide (TPR) repeat protein